ncbi:hypothetical protein ARMSODRAFT_1061455 [Armillaria solidipes]|uniref:Uncharacterized protein n=1 Tax=Armillaria solidipes TaxID=1076256 RepID=A0A2H3AY76_9AGAR|nr:hypothetical protein ARMSODRAFT_1061455 [Armillaria solidipes]
MTTRTYFGTATPKLADSQVKEMFASLDAQFNNMVLDAFLHASRNNYQDYRRPHFLGFTILLLYILSTVGVYCEWVDAILTFITAGESFWTAYNATPTTSTRLTEGIVACLSTNLADATLARDLIIVFIWRCWMVWVSRGIITYYGTFGSLEKLSPQDLLVENIISWSTLYSSLILATLLWCTILIIYRILRVGGAAGRVRVYQRVIEMLVESASLYSAVLVVLMVFQVRNELTGYYIENLAIAMRGIAPTILVGRVAAGHARPDDSWSESTTRSSLRFRNDSSSQNDSQMSVGSGQDTSSPVRPDIEEGLEDSEESTDVRVEGAAPTVSVHDCYAHVVGTSDSVDYSVV